MHANTYTRRQHFMRLIPRLGALIFVFFLTGCASNLPRIDTATFRNDGVVTHLYKNAVSEKAPLVFLLSGSEGGMISVPGFVDAFRDKGFHVVSAGYFRIEGIPAALDRIDIENIHKAIAYYKSKDYVIPNKIIVYGISKGGELALLLASEFPDDVNGVIALVPSRVAFQADAITPFHHSSWTREGKEVPFAPFNTFSIQAVKAAFSFIGSKDGAKYIDFYKETLENKDAERSALIQVEKIKGPILLISGKYDHFWPSTYMCEAIMARLKASNFEYGYRHLALNTNHFVLNESWDAVDNFLDKYNETGKGKETIK